MEGHAEDGDGETVESLLSFLRATARDEAQGGGGDASTSTSQLPYVVPQFPIDVDEVDIYDQDTGDLLPTPSQENVDGKDGDGARGGHAHTDAKRFLLATFKDKDTVSYISLHVHQCRYGRIHCQASRCRARLWT